MFHLHGSIVYLPRSTYDLQRSTLHIQRFSLNLHRYFQHWTFKSSALNYTSLLLDFQLTALNFSSLVLTIRSHFHLYKTNRAYELMDKVFSFIYIYLFYNPECICVILNWPSTCWSMLIRRLTSNVANTVLYSASFLIGISPSFTTL